MFALPGGRLLLAFSGGPDSLGLATRLRDRSPLLAYVDHRLRGPSASRVERARVGALARDLGLDLVRARIPEGGAGEARARAERYRALHALLRRHGCSAVATAHTADDRAETILLNLLRGTGLRGLASPLPRARIGGVLRVRPALGTRRDELRASAAPRAPVHDPTNRATGRARSRARAVLLPALAHALGEDPVPLLCGLGDLALALRAELEARAQRLAGGAARATLLNEPPPTFPYLVEALRGAGTPLTGRAYRSLRAFLEAGRRDRSHVTPGGDAWTMGADGRVAVTR